MTQYEHFYDRNPISAMEFEEVFSLMKQAFPKTEMRSYQAQKDLLQNPLYHLLVRKDEGAITAFFAYWETPTLCFGEHFAVSDSLRGQGIGGLMLDKLTQNCQVPFVLEVELPETELAKRRIAFYRRHGFYLNEYTYFQPALQENCEKIPLYLMSHRLSLDEEAFISIRDQLYQEVYHVIFNDSLK
ncbi:GNAT family N-acetyltransferase [Scatolibacter rhodanostii]|uniref:GNAT family N-acetyltransferase n=1 Tax=Scatolibacter rhodanostii TaxID=2014781 RepID=UPI000C075CBC|nr:GNAT family N-acetyltransferase [Scatolibacter rhodanostii]